MKNVRIQSDRTIQVTSGLECNDLTVEDSDVKDRVKVQAIWKRCLIKKGVGIYPAEVAKWPTTKALEQQGILAVTVETDEAATGEVNQISKQTTAKPHTEEKQAERRGQVKVVKDLTLDAVAGE